MRKLKILYARDDCGINDQGIKDLLNLEQLYTQNNNKIINVNHTFDLNFD